LLQKLLYNFLQSYSIDFLKRYKLQAIAAQYKAWSMEQLTLKDRTIDTPSLLFSSTHARKCKTRSQAVARIADHTD